jgi:hypothetical protein
MRATYTRTKGVRHLFADYKLGEDKLFRHIKPRKTRARFLESWGCRTRGAAKVHAMRLAWETAAV